MREITIRQLLRDFKSLLPIPEEGIKVTRRDGEAFFIYPSVRQLSDKLPGMSDETGEKNKKFPVRRDIPEEITGWCQLHFEKGVQYVLKLISWEDENGNPVIVKKLACPMCINRYETLGRGKLYYL